jgi:hypothetical protein
LRLALELMSMLTFNNASNNSRSMQSHIWNTDVYAMRRNPHKASVITKTYTRSPTTC